MPFASVEFVYLTQTSIGAKLDTLVQSVENTTYPTEEIQTFINVRMQDLRSELLRFDEVVAESRKAKESNDALNQQLEAEQKHTQHLTEQVRVLRQNEEDLKERQALLERQLSEINDKAQDDSAVPVALEQETADLRQQLRRVEDELGDRDAEIARLERSLEEHEELGYKDEVHRLTAACDEMKVLIQQHDKNIDAARARDEAARREVSEVRAEIGRAHV